MTILTVVTIVKKGQTIVKKFPGPVTSKSVNDYIIDALKKPTTIRAEVDVENTASWVVCKEERSYRDSVHMKNGKVWKFTSCRATYAHLMQ